MNDIDAFFPISILKYEMVIEKNIFGKKIKVVRNYNDRNKNFVLDMMKISQVALYDDYKEYYDAKLLENTIKLKEKSLYNENTKYFSDSLLFFYCKSKIRSALSYDKKKFRSLNYDEYVTNHWITDMLHTHNCKCMCCNCVMALFCYDSYEKSQFTINRINNKLPHYIYNCNIVCLFCNISQHNTHFDVYIKKYIQKHPSKTII